MKILVAVPSKNRAEELVKYTYSWLSKVEGLDIDYRIFVEPQDYDSYGVDNLVNIGQNDQGLFFVKQFIYDYALENGYDAIFKVDDDVRGWTNYRAKQGPEDSAKTFIKIIEESVKQFNKHPEIKAVGFPYSFQMFSQFEWAKSNRLQTCYLVRTESFSPKEGVSVFEDFYTALRIRVNGGMILRYGLSGIDLGNGVGKGKGGLQMFDRDELAKKEIEIMKELYPMLTVKEVKGKSWSVEPVLDIVY